MDRAHNLSASLDRLGKKGQSYDLGVQASGTVSTLQHIWLAQLVPSVHEAAVRATDLPHRTSSREKQHGLVGKQVQRSQPPLARLA
jgi:hypothetical protein